MGQIIGRWHTKVPILGICLGHQALGELFGAELVKAQKPMHGKLSKVISTAEDKFLNDMPTEFDVVRYHSLILEDLPSCLEATAYTSSGEIMAIKHKQRSIAGLQFHPEAVLTDNGLQMLHNWVRFYQIAD